MPYKRSADTWPVLVAAIVLTASAYFVSTGFGTFWPAAWFAPLPILLLATRRSVRTTALAAGAAYFLGSLSVINYLASLMPVPAAVITLLVPAAVFALAVLAFRAAARRLPAWLAVFAFPAAWTTFEFLLSLASPHGTALSHAYSQTDFLPLLQLASVTGIWGITFFLTMVPAAVALAYSRRGPAPLLPAAAIAMAVLGYGAYRLLQPQQDDAIRVGLAATDQGIEAAFETENTTQAMATANAYAGRIARLGARGVQVVVLPEKLVGVTRANTEAVSNVFASAARAAGVTVIAGFNHVISEPRRNLATVFAPDGETRVHYEKHHLLPGLETGYGAGSEIGIFSAAGSRWGVAICKDMDFPAWSRRYGRQHVRILAVPSWDFVRDGRLHARMAVVRGVENGFALARVAQQGLLTLSDAYGRIVAETPSSASPDAMLVAELSPGPGRTLYTRTGDWLGWISVALLPVLLGMCATNRSKRAASRRAVGTAPAVPPDTVAP